MPLATPELFKGIDLSVDPAVIQEGEQLMGNSCDPEAAKRWIHSPIKALWERSIFGFLPSCLSAPIILGAMKKVLEVDGPPPLYHFQVGFLGRDDEIVNPTEVTKIRTLKRGADRGELERPLQTTAFQGGRRRSFQRDERVHSNLGRKLRRMGIDEFPQFWGVFLGNFSFVSARAYSRSELEGLKIFFQAFKDGIVHFPDGFPGDCQATVSFVRPKPGLTGLPTALLRKDATVTERLWLDDFYLKGANPRADFRIILETFKIALRGTGAR